MQEEIAKIRSTHIGYEDHGLFSININFDYGGAAQGTGHHCVCSSDCDQDWDAAGIRFIKRFMDAAGVSEWGQLVGRTVFVIREDGLHGQIRGIKPLPTERGEPFMFAEVFDAFREEVPA